MRGASFRISFRYWYVLGSLPKRLWIWMTLANPSGNPVSAAFRWLFLTWGVAVVGFFASVRNVNQVVFFVFGHGPRRASRQVFVSGSEVDDDFFFHA